MRRTSILCAILGLLMCVQYEAHATAISFRWSPTTNTLFRDPGTYGTAVQVPANSTMLIYVSSDNNISFQGNNWQNGTDLGDYGSETDDFLLYTNTISAGTYRHNPSYTEYGTAYGGYYTYVVVFDYPYANFVANGYAIPDGTDYSVCPTTFLLNGQAEVPAPTAQILNPGANVILVTDQNLTIVPEPTTLALFATGVGVLMMRRRKKQAGKTEQSA